MFLLKNFHVWSFLIYFEPAVTNTLRLKMITLKTEKKLVYTFFTSLSSVLINTDGAFLIIT